MRLSRPPDFFIGPKEHPYMHRWWVVPRNPWLNIYLHKVLRSDDDRALHDHPWWNVSVVLRTGYFEVVPFVSEIRGSISADLPYQQRRLWRGPGSVVFRRAEQPHRLEIPGALSPPTWTLFITGPRCREWGFHCPKGWRHWREYVLEVPGGNEIGRGCEDQ